MLFCNITAESVLQMRMAGVYIFRRLAPLTKFRNLAFTSTNLQFLVDQAIAPGKPLPGPPDSAEKLRALGRDTIVALTQQYKEEHEALKQISRFVSALFTVFLGR